MPSLMVVWLIRVNELGMLEDNVMIRLVLKLPILFSIVSCSQLLAEDHVTQSGVYLEDQYKSAEALYENSKTQLEAFQIFKSIIAKDSCGCFWKSYVYIANIYLRMNQVDSASKILEYGEKRIPQGEIWTNLHAYRSEVSPDSLLDLQKERRIGFDDTVIDTPPEPIGGSEEFQKNIKYPEDDFQIGIEDTVFVAAYITLRGDVCETKVLKGGKTPSLIKAAREAIYRTRWQPAKGRDKPVSVWMQVPVKFRLK